MIPENKHLLLAESELPIGWEIYTLEDVAEIIRGVTFPSSAKKTTPTKGHVTCLRTTNVQNEIEWDDLLYIPENYVKSQIRWLAENDILISMANSFELVGKVALNRRNVENVTFGGFISAIRTQYLDPKFLYFALREPTIKENIRQTASKTVNIANISMKGIYPTKIPIPPREEQSRIVNAIESLQKRSTKARTLLTEVEPLIDNLRQSILQSAFSGRLTADWRAKNPDIEPADILLERIRVERRKRWEAREITEYKSKGKEPPKNWRDKFIDIPNYKSAVFPSIKSEEKYHCTAVGIPFTHTVIAPKTWNKYKLLDVVEIVGGSQPPKSNFASEKKDGYIRLIQIRDYKSDKFKVYIPTHLAKRFCTKEEIMIGRYGPPVFQILRGIEGAYNVALMKAIPDELFLSEDYLFYYLQSPSIQHYVEADSERTAGQSGVNKKKLSEYPIYLPTLAEQREIIKRLKSALQYIDNLAKACSTTQEDLYDIDQAILTKAFRGELVAQDSNDETASDLLKIQRPRDAEK